MASNYQQFRARISTAMITMILTSSLLVMSFALAGCPSRVPLNWAHPTKAQDEFEKDDFDCRMEVAQYASARFDPIFTSITGAQGDCLWRKHGWRSKESVEQATWVHPSKGKAEYSRDFEDCLTGKGIAAFNACMKEKNGWRTTK